MTTLVRFFLCCMLTVGVVAAPVAAQPAPADDRPGILVLAHGGNPVWNGRVEGLAASLDAEQPTTVAFGMASRPAIQAAVDRLVARGVTRIVAVPLFISSHSSVVTSTAYLLGQRQDMPADLPLFAKMSHGHGAAAHGSHGGHAAQDAPAAAGTDGDAGPAVDGTTPVRSPVPIDMTSALDRHPLVGEILVSRLRSISQQPERESVVLVAHGPVPDDDNRRWLADMGALASVVRQEVPVASIDWLTVRDDAPAPVREAATAELRGIVSARAAEGRQVLILPLLLSYGGIERGIRRRLEGLDYTMPDEALMPDDRLATWVRLSVR